MVVIIYLISCGKQSIDTTDVVKVTKNDGEPSHSLLPQFACVFVYCVHVCVIQT